MILKKGADINKKEWPDGRTLLMEAAISGNVEAIGFMLAHGADPDSGNDFGVSPLQWAVQQGHAEAADKLVESGADPNACDREGQSVLMVACFRAALTGEEKMRSFVAKLIEKGADLDRRKKGGWTALMWTADMGDIDMVRMLCENGADAALRNDNGDDAMDLAVKRGRKNVAEYLGSIEKS